MLNIIIDKMTYTLSCFVSGLSQLMLTSKQPVEKVFLLLSIKISFSQATKNLCLSLLSFISGKYLD